MTGRVFRVVRIVGLVLAALVVLMMVVDAVDRQWWRDGVTAADLVPLAAGLVIVAGLVLGAWRPLWGGVLLLASAAVQAAPSVQARRAGPGDLFALALAVVGALYLALGWRPVSSRRGALVPRVPPPERAHHGERRDGGHGDRGERPQQHAPRGER